MSDNCFLTFQEDTNLRKFEDEAVFAFLKI